MQNVVSDFGETMQAPEACYGRLRFRVEGLEGSGSEDRQCVSIGDGVIWTEEVSDQGWLKFGMK